MKSAPSLPRVARLVSPLRPAILPGLALFLLLLGWYVLTTSGHTYANDEETMLAAGESLLNTGSFAISPDLPLTNRTIGVDGRSYSRYGPAQSIAVVPFLVAGRVASRTAPNYAAFINRLFVLLLPALVTAATAVILYAWVRRLDYAAWIALVTGLLYGLTSMAWPYSRTLFAEPLATFFLVLATYGLRSEDRKWWTLAGLALVSALAAKFQTALAVPLIVGYGVLVCLRRDRRSTRTALLGRLEFGLLGLAVPLALLFFYNIRLFGAPLNTGYGFVGAGEVAGFLGGSWQEGLYGLTISSGKGLLTYSPTILLGLLGLIFARRQQWRESLLALGMLAAHLAFYSRVSYWHGDGSWGPRYLVFILPFVYLPVAGLLATVARRRGRFFPTIIGGLVAVSLVLQFLPLLVNFDAYLQTSQPEVRYFQPQASPIVAQVRTWVSRAKGWWSRTVPPAGTAELSDGFSYSEGDRAKGELLPRWSTGDAVITLYPDPAWGMEGRIVLADHRPWPLPRAKFNLLLDGKALPLAQRRDLTGESIWWELDFQIRPDQAYRGATLELQSDTWNPSQVQKGNHRNEDLGVMVQTVELMQHGKPLAIGEALPVPPLPSTRYGLFLWYQGASLSDRPIPHLLDVWEWYLLVAGLPRRAVTLFLVVIGLPSLVCFAVGLISTWRALRLHRAREPVEIQASKTNCS